MPKFDVSSLEGWLTKKRGPGKQKVMGILSGDSKRWFQVKELNSANQAEVTLCYFKSQHEKEARGWIYMKDVTDLYDDGKTITIVSVARSITVEAKSRAEHKFWLEGIANLCPLADKSGLQTEVKCFAENKDDSQNSSRQNSSRGGSFDVKDTNSGNYKREREEQKLIAESKGSLPNSARSSRSGRDTDDIEDRDRYTSDREYSSSRDSNFQGERHRERGNSSREGRGRGSSSREGGGRSDNSMNTKNLSKDDPHRESKSSGHRDKDSREDHRVSSADGLPLGRMGIGEGATTRLHSHIRKDAPLSPNSAPKKPPKNDINDQPQENNMRDKDHTPVPKPYSFPKQYVYDNAPDDDVETLENSLESLPSPSSDRDHRNLKADTATVGRDTRIEKLREKEIDQMNTRNGKTPARLSSDDSQDLSNRNGNGFNNSPEKKSLFKKNERSRASYDEELSSEEEEGATVNLQVEKERRNSKNNDLNETASRPTSEGSGPGHVVRGRPPLPPNGSKPNPYTAIGKIQPSSSYSAYANNNQISRDTNLNDNWDDSDEEDNKDVHSSVNKNRMTQPKASGPAVINNGVRADTNWLEDDFDDT
mmetsp:Transcript_11868/g.11524  ORF Transcript_11868/g.11524 Transcript_11868/m.11524 type:complete len:593 (-) Transcript_11868:362-2140(-)|eukprot:CAMPEP_0119047502 /NCGR_PEP_ID=MMETSP1177-20130426/53465_1 /TAXON_ID=2985 /ORGANISM="Ochromonas sp, Strain CCMP1899" /LENGTH=592 /DNA_ID=CAMNT_0007022191 /DNA_START=159 /DNA_END=1937 /DNA_ORIENTATION=-